jgi:hypothetical protein
MMRLAIAGGPVPPDAGGNMVALPATSETTGPEHRGHADNDLQPVAKERKMRRTLLFLATLAAFAATLAVQPAAASDRYCLQGRVWGYPGNCQFASYQQCLATASGTDSSCGLNPRYAFPPQPRRGAY